MEALRLVHEFINQIFLSMKTLISQNLYWLISLMLCVFTAEQVNGQVTFGTLFTGDGVGGTENYSTSSPTVAPNVYRVLNATTGSGSEYMKPRQYPLFVSADIEGNVVVNYNGSRAVTRIDKIGGKAIVFYNSNVTNVVSVDKLAEYVYLANANTITRSIWKNTGSEFSVGYYSSQPVGTETQVKTYPFLKQGDLVFRNGKDQNVVVDLNPYNDFNTIKGMAFDNEGNLFYADAGKHVIRKVSLIYRKVADYSPEGTNVLTLNSVEGIKPFQLVSGPNIPAGTYVKSVVGNEIELINAVGNDVNIQEGGIDNQVSITFLKSIDDVVGIYEESGNDLGSTAGESKVNFSGISANLGGVGMSFDKDGNLYFSDKGNARILKVTAVNGQVTSISPISVLITGLKGDQMGVVVDDLGNLYVATDNRIYKLGPSGGALATANIIAGSGGRYSVALATMTGSNEATGTINQDVTVTGSYIRSGAFPVNSKVMSVAADAKSLIVDQNATTATTTTSIITSPDGFVTTGMGGVGTGRLDGPFGMTLVKNGNSFDLIYTETLGHHVRKLSGVSSLPIILSKPFTAKLAVSGIVDLSWSTASEQNNDYFIIKRSTDGKMFSPLSTVYSKGNIGANYYSVDFNPYPGDNYYELSQIDKDGTTKKIGLQVVKVAVEKPEISIYPNPVIESTFFISAPLIITPAIMVNISTLSGSQVYKQYFNKTENGIYEISLNPKLASGIYMISINNEQHQKLIIK